MQSLPFRLLVVNELDLRDVARGDRQEWQPPGVVEELDAQPLWKSKPNVTSPQELGLILLSAEPAAIKSLCLRVRRPQAPAQIVIFAAIPGTVNDGLSKFDLVSRYLSVKWKQCGEPLKWDACSPTRLDTSCDIDSRIVPLNVAECSFIKLIAYGQNKSSRRQVVLEDIELMGSTEDSSLAQRTHTDKDRSSHQPGVIRRPGMQPLANDYDELQAVLLDAGVPMDLVIQIAGISKREKETLTQIPPESNSPTSKPEDETLAPKDQIQEENCAASPFDTALRQYIEQSARERSTLEKILDTKMTKDPDDVSSWQSPTVSSTDPTNSKEIILYTFGPFFTQCLLCGGADPQVTCIQMVERAAPLLKNVIGATCAFEGVIALIVLGIREAKTSYVFKTAIHLAYTVFRIESSDVLEAEQPGGSSALKLVEEVARANWNYGLRVILEWTLASSFCWSVSHNGKLAASKMPPSVDRAFLQFIRLLVEQDLTRTVFFDELLSLSPTRSTTGLIFARNRLRLLRMILQNDTIRCHVSTNVETSIRTLCTSLLCLNALPSDELALKRDDKGILARLASECLDKLDQPRGSSYSRSNHVASVRRHLEDVSNAQSHHSHHYTHTALFIQDASLEAEMAACTVLLQRYFSFQRRPNGLYRHSFVRVSQVDAKTDEVPESFQKGNIAFQGQVLARIPPTQTFHDEIQQKSAPYVFEINDKKSSPGILSPPAGKQDVVSSFASFKGTIERRSDLPKRSNKVSPDHEIPAPLAAKALTSKELVTATCSDDTAEKILPSGSPGLKSSTKESTFSPVIGTVNQAPLTSNRTSAAVDIAAAGSVVTTDGPVSILVDKYEPPEVIEHLISTKNTNDRRKRGAKVKSKDKGNDNDPDHCVLQ
ncbi:hypothetical protein GN958_ATG09905 [Phytophthora infestans]|uniref:Uncharacterized protein n=1 Tax=Phytophthora infestans TaxID=4787 RepID=A0A8S9UNF6_PHYIN|nr:hypothetical protein GN958_ATG09905 [Phytophthora infestans]